MHSPIKVVDPVEFFAVKADSVGCRYSHDFCKATVETLQRAWKHNNTATALVRFVVQDLCSSMAGHTQYLFVGPDNSIKSWEEAQDKHLGDVPSRFHYPDIAILLPGPTQSDVPDPFVAVQDVKFSQD